MPEFYSMQKRGGVTTSKIEHQDSVGLILCMELLDERSRYYSYFNNGENWKIMFEGNDDLEIVHSKARMFIQVKSSKINNKDFADILENFKKNYNGMQVDNVFFKLCVFYGISLKDSSFPEKHREYQNSKLAYPKAECDQNLDELLNLYKIDFKYRDIIDKLEIDERPFLKDAEDTQAIFAEVLRRAYSIIDFGSKKTLEIYKELTYNFAYGRRIRKPNSKQEILHIINKYINSNNLMKGIELKARYKKTKYGYLPSAKAADITNSLIKSNNAIVRKIMRQWRKAFFKEFLISIIVGSCRCPNCNHPLMANIYGLNGIACPDCGFQPYSTLFLGCSCGEYSVIQTQIDFTTDEYAGAVLEYFKKKGNSKCKSCSKDLLDEYWEYRLIVLPVPYPFDNFDLKALYYEAREFYKHDID